MRSEHIHYLRDPLTRASLTLTSFTEHDGHVIAGLLTTNNHWYPIINGIPRLLTGPLRTTMLRTHAEFTHTYRDQLPNFIVTDWQAISTSDTNTTPHVHHQQKTGDSFAYEWANIYQENSFERQNFLHFLHPYLAAEDLRNRTIIDAGCGSGRFTKQAALCGAKVVIGTDVGDSVEPAYHLTRHLPNTCIIQADIYAMPLASNFDLVLSIGVLHHLPEPERGFHQLRELIKPTGHILIWVYNRRHNFRAVYIFENLRRLTRHLPPRVLFTLCYIPAALVHMLNLFTQTLRQVGATTAAKKIPFGYYTNFPFNMKLTDAFDVLATPQSNYYYVEDIEQWFAHQHLQHISAYEHPEAGITCMGTHVPA